MQDQFEKLLAVSGIKREVDMAEYYVGSLSKDIQVYIQMKCKPQRTHLHTHI